MTFRRRLATVVGLVLCGLVLGALSSTTEAQTTSASVSGTVQDAHGGVQPGVTVTLTSRTQGHGQTTVTEGSVFKYTSPAGFTQNIIQPINLVCQDGVAKVNITFLNIEAKGKYTVTEAVVRGETPLFNSAGTDKKSA